MTDTLWAALGGTLACVTAVEKKKDAYYHRPPCMEVTKMNKDVEVHRIAIERRKVQLRQAGVGKHLGVVEAAFKVLMQNHHYSVGLHGNVNAQKVTLLDFQYDYSDVGDGQGALNRVHGQGGRTVTNGGSFSHYKHPRVVQSKY